MLMSIGVIMIALVLSVGLKYPAASLMVMMFVLLLFSWRRFPVRKYGEIR